MFDKRLVNTLDEVEKGVVENNHLLTGAERSSELDNGGTWPNSEAQTGMRSVFRHEKHLSI